MIDIEPHADGAIVLVRAQPGSRTNSLRGEQAGALKVSVTQIAEKGKANKAIIELLAGKLKLRKSRFEIISGESSQHKKILIRDISPIELQVRLTAL